MQITIYGEGGYDPNKPNDNIVEQFEVPDPEPNLEEIVKNSTIELLLAKVEALEETIKTLTNKE